MSSIAAIVTTVTTRQTTLTTEAVTTATTPITEMPSKCCSVLDWNIFPNYNTMTKEFKHRIFPSDIV